VKSHVEKLTIGCPYKNAIGPLVDKMQYEKVLSFIDSGKNEAKLLVIILINF
jgi:acyl-CoA reductase-like NAD-dependent aldehyde dehydrogenase